MHFLHQLTTLKPELINRIEAMTKIENQPYMTLTVENIGPGPRGLPALSICHYGEQNGDLMRDPEMCFEMQIEDGKVKAFHPYYFRNDYAGMEQEVMDVNTGHTNQRILREQTEFAKVWSRNLEEQGFLRDVR